MWRPLGEALAQLQQATMWFMQKPRKSPTTPAPVDRLQASFGWSRLAYMGAQMAKPRRRSSRWRETARKSA